MLDRLSSQTDLIKRYALFIALGLIVLFGAILRFTGINWDEYQHLHPDERFLTMVETGIQMPSSIGDYFDTANSPLNPYNRNFGTYVYGTYPLFLVKFVGVLASPFGAPIAKNFMTEPGPTDFSTYATMYRVLTDPGGYEGIYIIGRILSGLFDLSTVLVIFFIGRRLYDTRVGLLAAFFLAFSVLDIQQSHFFTVDTFANLPLVLAVWFSLDIADRRGGRLSFLLAGAFFGLALAARINLATFAAIIGLAVALRIIKILESIKGVSLAQAPLKEVRTLQFAAESLASPDEPHERTITLGQRLDGQTDPHEGNFAQAAVSTSSTRVLSLGPLTIELESVPKLPVGSDVVAGAAAQPVEKRELAWVEPLMGILVGLGLAVFAAFVVFRVAQPYAFEGIGLNPKWLQDINSLKDILSGAADYPPGHQWANRADYLFPLQNIVLWGLGLPLGLAAVLGFLVAGYELAARREWRHLLIFFWVGGTFLYQGQQYVKTMRYSLPLYPFFALFAAFFLFWLWDHSGGRDRFQEYEARVRAFNWRDVIGSIGRVLAIAAFAVAVGYTLFWALAFTTIYTRPVSRVAASHWMVHNIPAGSAIGNEHWDDGLPLRVEGLDPFGSMFKGVSTSGDGLLDMYAEDTPEKRDMMLKWLDVTDYIVLSSNRLYGSITRLPLRYPMTTKYYQSLFDGSLGFELVKTFTSYPQLMGITINDDSSEEAFTVYDHPKVLIFKKTPAYSHDKFAAMLDSFDLTSVYRQTPLNYTISHGAYQLQPQDQAADYSGGTWSDIFNPNDLVNQIPVIVWLFVLEGLGIAAFPVTFAVFRSFADRGYAFAKAVGILALGWGAWTLGSYHLVGFSRTSILIALLGLVFVAAVAAWRQWRQLVSYIRSNLALVLVEEMVFIAFFFGFLLIRYGNPDLWHPYFGGEKPMDFAYLNAVIKTTWFPPYNPWFEGGYINYYYFGQLLSATLVRFTGILPEVAYNLLVPTFFGLTALGAFGVAFNLVSAIRRRSQQSRIDGEPEKVGPPVRAIAAGLLGAFFVVIIGNLGEVGVLGDGLLKLGEPAKTSLPGIGGLLTILSGLVAWLVERQVLPVATGNWYWTATRVIPDTINEFPFFTFLYADLHAHLMGLAYTLVALAIGLHAVLIRGRFKWYDLLVVGLVLGSLRAINTWDFPTYLALIGGGMVIGFFADRPTVEEPSPDWGERLKRYLAFGIVAFIQIMLVVIPTNAIGVKVTLDMIAFGLLLVFGLVLGWILVRENFDPRTLTRLLGWRFAALIVLSVVLYLPFLLNYGTAYTSVELWKDQRTNLTDYLTVHGIFLFLVGSYIVIELLRRRSTPPGGGSAKPQASPFFSEWILYVLPGLAVFEFILILENLRVFALVIPLVLLAAWLLLRRDSGPEHRFIALLMVTALVMTLVVEVVTLKGDIGRMNTVFKFYLQGWVLFAISSAAGLTLIFDRMLPKRVAQVAPERPTESQVSVGNRLKQAWWAALAILLFAGLLYPVFATWAKVNDRFVADSSPGLNGLDYMTTATYNVNNHDLQLIQDYKAIEWLRENIKGSPVIAEASYELYRWNDRVSINTGLPTIVGWDWHTKQQYSLIDGSIIDQRKQDIADLYNNADPGAVSQILTRYQVSYVYVGPLERALYDPAGLSKFEAMTEAGALSKVYDADGVQIYHVIAPFS